MCWTHLQICMTTIVLWPTKSNALKLVEQNLQTHTYINICRLECYKDNSQKLYRCWCTKFHPHELGNRYTYNQYTKIISTLFYNTIHFPVWLSHQNPSEWFFLNIWASSIFSFFFWVSISNNEFNEQWWVHYMLAYFTGEGCCSWRHSE